MRRLNVTIPSTRLRKAENTGRDRGVRGGWGGDEGGLGGGGGGGDGVVEGGDGYFGNGVVERVCA